MRVLIQVGSGEAGQRVSLAEKEVHHLRVRRARTHEGVEVLDGAGLIGTGQLVQVGTEWMVDIQTAERQTRQPDLTLAVASGDRERFIWMLEKAVELGVTAIIPLETERSATVATRVRGSHLDKLRRLALEATKQCGAAWAPEVWPPIPLAEFLARPIEGAGWLADSAGDTPSARLNEEPLTAVVGPEGGFTTEERDAILTSGYRPVRLGAHTMRFETAALAAAMAAVTARMRGSHG